MIPAVLGDIVTYTDTSGSTHAAIVTRVYGEGWPDGYVGNVALTVFADMNGTGQPFTLLSPVVEGSAQGQYQPRVLSASPTNTSPTYIQKQNLIDNTSPTSARSTSARSTSARSTEEDN